MTKTKRVVAVMLAFLMIFSSASVLASAWDASIDDGSTLEISTKFFKEVDGAWAETTKVRPGDTVKARVYLGTDYYSNGSTLLFFYDKDFFSHAYSTSGPVTLETNSAAGISGTFAADPDLSAVAADNGVDSSFLNDYSAFYATVKVGDGSKNLMFDDSTWLFEFTLTVNGDADGEGDLFVKESSIQSTTKENALTNVPKGPSDGSAIDVWPMWLWDATAVLSSQPVSTISSVTFNANTGVFADDTTEYVVEDLIDTAIDASAIPAVSKDGYSFMGWIDAADTTPTYEEIVEVPAAIPEKDLVLNAFWMENVDITFDTDGGSEIPAIENVTPYSEFAEIAAPTKDGYTFVGWDERGTMNLPATYPDVDTTYTAIWAKNVTLTFETDGGTAIAPVDGVAGEAFDASSIADPTKLGHRFIMWSPKLPAVFPEADTTYNAIFEALTNTVMYYAVDAETGDVDATATMQGEYGTVIPTNIPTLILPEGKKFVDGVWYTDPECTTPLAEGATVSEAKVQSLYTKTELATYDAVFVTDDGETRVPTVYGDVINVPADPAKEGYVFAGWSPDPVVLEEPNDMYFYATWEEAVNKAVYVVDGNEYEVYDVANGDDLDVPADPDKEGYTFIGWTDVENGTTAITLPAKMPGTSVRYYAIFEINEYTITFNVDGGTAVDAITQEFDTAITADTTTTKTGYTFAGWVDAEGAKVEVPAKMPAEDITLKATWTVNEYTITFVDTGDVAYEEIKQDYDSVIAPVDDPIKTGYTFTGWDIAIPGKMPAEDLTITATWEANVYDAVFDANGGTFSDGKDTATVPTAYDSDIVAPADPTKTGYEFGGWTPAVGKMDTVGGESYTAIWNAKGDTAYTVITYTMGADGEYVESSEGFTGATDTKATAVVPSLDAGFALNSDKSVLEGIIAPNGSLVLEIYIDRVSYTFTLDNDNGSDLITKDYLFGATIDAATAPTKVGYTFKGWAETKGATEADKVELPVTMPASDATYYAIWAINTHNVVWTIDGKDTTVPYEFGATITAPEASKTGYEFKGWTPAFAEGTTMPDNDLAFTAVFEPITYDAVFDADGGVFADGQSTATVPTAFDSDIIAPADPTKTGYVFGGWTPAVGKMDTVGGESYTAIWSNALNTPYKVETYTMDTTGNYGAPAVSNLTAETGSDVTAQYTVGEGFKLGAGSVTEGKVAADGSLVLKVYLERNKYAFAVDNANGDEVISVDYYYGAKVAEPTEPEKTGYTFDSWSPEVPSTMPANAVTVVAQWTPNSDTEYKVVVNYTDVVAGAQTAEFFYTGTTDNAIAIVDAIPETPAENTEYVLMSDLAVSHFELDESAANEFTGKVAADGSTVLNLYYKAVIYTATFNTNDGAFTDGETSKQVNLAYNTLVKENAPADPVRDGYEFAGWQGLNDSTRLTGNRAFNATWEAKPYTFTWIIDGKEETVTYKTDELIVKKADPTKVGYTFTGWDIEIPDKMPANNLTATAQFEVNQYTITFDVDGGTPVAEIKQDYDSAITADTTTTKTGYTFAGWTDINGIAATVPAKMPAENMTLKATWTINQYTISFDVDGGTPVAEIKQDYNTDILLAPTSTKTGYTFIGWAEVKGGEKVDLPAKMPAENKTYYAIWEVNEYVITFDKDNGEAAETVTAAYNSDVDKIADPAKAGYTFKGWATTKGVTDASQAVTFPVKMPLNGTTYYAIWTVNSYTVTFDKDNGEAAETVTAAYNSDVNKIADPAKTGYTFGGWATDKGVTDASQAVTFPVKMPINGATYYAIWTIENYTVKWDNDGNVTTENYNYGATLNIPAPTKTGYDFVKWEGLAEGTTTMPDIGANGASVTYTAVWSAKTYDAIFNANDGAWTDGDTTKTVPTVFDQAIVAPANPVRAGYIFNGWTPAVGNMDKEGITFEATWVADSATRYTIKTYTMGTDGIYGAAVETIGTGATDTEADATPATVAEGFTLDTEKSTLKGTILADNSLVLEVYISRNQYTFTVDVDGTETSNDYYYGATVVTPVTPVKEGYTFTTWTPAVPSTMPANNVKITANWSLNSWTVYYVIEGDVDAGEYTKVENVDYGTDVTVIAAPVKDGYTFSGWSQTGTFAMPDNNVTITGSYTANDYTITFDTDGGDVINSITLPYGSAITAPANPEKSGYTFAGWVNAEGAKVEVPATMPLNGMALTATWTPNNYTVTYYLDKNMTAPAVYTTTAAYLQQYNVPTPTKEGHTFVEWIDAATGASAGLTAGGLTTIPVDGATYYADWTVNNYKLVYRTYNGVYFEKEVAYGTAKADMPTPDADPTREGYTFTKWNAELPETMPASQVNLVALWDIENYTVTWNYADGVTADVNEAYDFGADLVIPEPSRTGYEFGGWYNGDVELTDTTMADIGDDGAKITYTAKWIANEYDAIFNANDGAFTDGDKSKTVPTLFDEKIVAPAAPVRAGYTFNGWNPAVDTMNVEGGMTFEATWLANDATKYTIKTYTMGTDGVYGAAVETFGAGATDTEADATPATVADGFTLDTTKSTLKGTITADEGLVLEVYISRNKYTFTVDKNDGTPATETEYFFEQAVDAVADPTREGYTFKGWNNTVPTVMPANDVAVKANWDINTWHVYYKVDGTQISSMPVTYGTDVTIMEAPTKLGYTFSGWKIDGADAANFTMPDKDVTIEGTFTINTHDVIYMVNGEEYTREPHDYGSIVTVLAPIEKIGYTFSGWDKPNFTMPDEDVIITGTLTAINYTVTWVDGNDETEDKVDTLIYEATITAPEAPTKVGYTFAGWKDADGAMFAEGATMPAKNVVYTAQWTANSGIAYVVKTYKMNLDGTTYAETSETLYGIAGETATAEVPAVDGFTFNAAKSTVSGAIAGDGSLVLEVYYDRNKIAVTVENVEEDLSGDYYYEAVITTVPTPVIPEGHKFTGWKNENGELVAFPYTVPAEADGAITISPKFEALNYNVTWVYANGSEDTTNAVTYGTVITAPTQPTKVGYTFAGWYDADGAKLEASTTMPAKDVTYTAEWTANSGIAYTVNVYKMDLAGEYQAEAPQTLYGTAGATVTAETPDVEGFTFNSAKSTVSGTIAGDGSLILSVYYDRNKITVNVNGEEKEYFYDDVIPAPADPTAPEGKEFTGWVDDNGNTVTFPYNVPDEEDKKIIITPKFESLDYTVTFIYKDGTSTEATVTYGDAITAPEAPAVDGYRFVMWADAEGKSVTDYATMPAKNLTFTAVYETGAYQVNYWINGEIVANKSAEYGEEIVTGYTADTKVDLLTYKTAKGYVFDGWYTDAAMQNKLADGATVGSANINLYASEVAGTYDAVFMNEGVEYQRVPTAYGDVIILPAEPTKEGYTFTGWSPDAVIMDEEGMTFEATWIETPDAYTATYMVDGEEYEKYSMALGEDLDVPADPAKEGYNFLGWSESADSDVIATLPATMPAKNLTYYAVFTVNAYTATFYNYEATDASPYRSEQPTAVMSAVGYDYGDTVAVPANPANLNSAYWTFMGWSDAVDGEVKYTAESVITMPANDLTLYAVYERVAVKLVPADGSTTVIERDGVKESIAEGTVTAEPYATPDSYEQWFIYGLKYGLSKTAFESSWIKVQGDGRVEVTLSSTRFAGTGTLVEVYDNVTGEKVEQFYVVIFGDLDGNSRLTVTDSATLIAEISSPTWSSTANRVHYLFKAANLDGNRRLTVTDSAILEGAAGSNITIDQVTGREA